MDVAWRSIKIMKITLEASSCGFAKILDPARFCDSVQCELLVISAQNQLFLLVPIVGAHRNHHFGTEITKSAPIFW